MKRATFLEGVAVAIAASLAAGACYAALTLAFSNAAALRFVVAGLALAYVIYLLGRNEERVGRITVVALWCVCASALWLLAPPFVTYLCAHLSVVWLVRSLYFHSSLLAALADLGLVALGLAAALWSVTRSHSVALSVWCFFLVQALYVAMPARLEAKNATRAATLPEDRFQHAHAAAEAALRRFHSPR
jgi:hypothetical protein